MQPSEQLFGLFHVESTLSRVIAELRKTADDPAVKAMVLRIDSPGGGVTASDTVYHRIKPGNWLEALSGDRAGQHSIRINDQFRICFVWTEFGPEQVEIVDLSLKVPSYSRIVCVPFIPVKSCGKTILDR